MSMCRNYRKLHQPKNMCWPHLHSKNCISWIVFYWTCVKVSPVIERKGSPGGMSVLSMIVDCRFWSRCIVVLQTYGVIWWRHMNVSFTFMYNNSNNNDIVKSNMAANLLGVCLSVYVSVYFTICLSVRLIILFVLFIHLSVSMFIRFVLFDYLLLSLFFCVCIFTCFYLLCLFVCSSVCLFAWMFVFLFVCVCVCVCVPLSCLFNLSVCLFLFIVQKLNTTTLFGNNVRKNLSSFINRFCAAFSSYSQCHALLRVTWLLALCHQLFMTHRLGVSQRAYRLLHPAQKHETSFMQMCLAWSSGWG